MEERLRFYEEGVAPTKNLTAMQAAIATARAADGDENVGQLEQPEKKKKKKRKAVELATEEAEGPVTVETGELALAGVLCLAMRRLCEPLSAWFDVKELNYSCQQDSNTCGLVVAALAL